MGLAAGQARLLTITGRKSDCEFESMRLSHQKIALSRELADLSNEYQNSLDRTKLVYDYYGTGTQDTPLSYGIMMYPSALNDNMPILLTNAQGRTVLNRKYAAAARVAGIPQEGLGTLPSEDVRNKFIEGLCGQELITNNLATTLQSIQYNQAVGVGSSPLSVTQITESGNIEALFNYIAELGQETFFTGDLMQTSKITRKNDDWDECEVSLQVVNNGKDINDANKFVNDISIYNLFKGEEQYYLAYKSLEGEETPVLGLAMMQDFLIQSGGFIDWLADSFSEILDLGDGYSGKAIEYAVSKTTDLFYNTSRIVGDSTGHDYWRDEYWKDDHEGDFNDDTDWDEDGVQKYVKPICGNIVVDEDDEEYITRIVDDSSSYIGFSIEANTGGSCWPFESDSNDKSTAGLSLNNVADVFLTYFADYMNGISKLDGSGVQVFDVNIGAKTNSHLASGNDQFQYTWLVDQKVDDSEAKFSAFYDALFNQLCLKGWLENDNVDDNSYLQNMLQSGMVYISKVKDDYYYYQENYATDSYIKEVADETYIAQAEAKYNTEKAKLNAKEETIDLKMKNLDTEISSLTTEYDTVKNTLSKNIEKSFKRYSA